MRVLVTGLRGTVGRALQAYLHGAGHDVIGWDRSVIPIDHYDAMEQFVARVAPDAVVNLAIASQPTGRPDEQWLVNHEWPSELAWICRQHGRRFLHTSTVMVFSPRAAGPFALDAVPDADEGYGLHKRLAEARVCYQYPEATVVRLGWQIGDAPGSNNMIDYFTRQVAETGVVHASPRFFPACSLLEDTAAALARALVAPPGLYQLDSNDGLSHLDIARALARRHGWTVREADAPVRDERMLDPRLGVPPLSSRLA